MALDERRQLEEEMRAALLGLEEAKKAAQNFECARAEDEKVHDAELQDYKVNRGGREMGRGGRTGEGREKGKKK